MLGARLHFNLYCSTMHFKDSSIELSTFIKEIHGLLLNHKMVCIRFLSSSPTAAFGPTEPEPYNSRSKEIEVGDAVGTLMVMSSVGILTSSGWKFVGCLSPVLSHLPFPCNYLNLPCVWCT